MTPADMPAWGQFISTIGFPIFLVLAVGYIMSTKVLPRYIKFMDTMENNFVEMRVLHAGNQEILASILKRLDSLEARHDKQ